MRAQVLRSYRDKYSHQLHKKNTEIEVTEERFEELNSTSLGIFVNKIKVDGEEITDEEVINVDGEEITDENKSNSVQNELENDENTVENESKTDQKPSKKGKK